MFLCSRWNWLPFSFLAYFMHFHIMWHCKQVYISANIVVGGYRSLKRWRVSWRTRWTRRPRSRRCATSASRKWFSWRRLSRTRWRVARRSCRTFDTRTRSSWSKWTLNWTTQRRWELCCFLMSTVSWLNAQVCACMCTAAIILHEVHCECIWDPKVITKDCVIWV